MEHFGRVLVTSTSQVLPIRVLHKVANSRGQARKAVVGVRRVEVGLDRADGLRSASRTRCRRVAARQSLEQASCLLLDQRLLLRTILEGLIVIRRIKGRAQLDGTLVDGAAVAHTLLNGILHYRRLPAVLEISVKAVAGRVPV